MGMDPGTGRFQHLSHEEAHAIAERDIDKLRQAMSRGTPEATIRMMQDWIVFAIGELVSIKGQQFRVVDIGGTHVVLRSYASEKAAMAVEHADPR